MMKCKIVTPHGGNGDRSRFTDLENKLLEILAKSPIVKSVMPMGDADPLYDGHGGILISDGIEIRVEYEDGLSPDHLNFWIGDKNPYIPYEFKGYKNEIFELLNS